jgi:pyruvate kinase
MSGRRTKIVATLGPASSDPDVLLALIRAGADVLRLNLSHETPAGVAAIIGTLLQLEREHGVQPGVLLDTAGPEVRVTGIPEGGRELLPGDMVCFGDGEGCIGLTHPGFLEDVQEGARLMLDDGSLVLTVSRPGNPLSATVEAGGVLKNHKKIQCPGVRLRLPMLTDSDRAAIAEAASLRLDWIAASFVQDIDDIFDVKRWLEDQGLDVPVMAKIETRAALQNLDDIVRVSDGIMVARGDLGVEMPAEKLPWLQKQIIEAANRMGRPVVTATQMLESMCEHPYPTRAEVTDVANAIWDGADAVMLSAESAAGHYPVPAVTTMARIALEADGRETRAGHGPGLDRETVTRAVTHATVTAAQDLGARAIICATESGYSALAIARLRPSIAVLAVTPHAHVARRLAVVWGVDSLTMGRALEGERMIEMATATALEAGRIKPGDMVVVVGGVPTGQAGTTNMMRVVTVGEAILRGQGMGLEQAATAAVLVVEDVRAVTPRQAQGKVLVARTTNREWVPIMEVAAALVVEEGGLTCHAAVVGLSLGKPTVVGAEEATSRLANGQIVTVDGRRGLVYQGAANV